MQTLLLRIEGMHCEACAETIRRLLAVETGVKASSVSFDERRARLLYDPEQSEESRLFAAIEKSSYRVAPAA